MNERVQAIYDAGLERVASHFDRRLSSISLGCDDWAEWLHNNLADRKNLQGFSSCVTAPQVLQAL